MTAIKIWLFYMALTYIGVKLFQYRQNYRRLIMKYGIVFGMGAILAVPFVTVYNVTHPHEALILAGEMGYKSSRVKRKIRKVEKNVLSKTPSFMKRNYGKAEKTYDRWVRPLHNHAAKTSNMFGIKAAVPKEGIVMRWAKSLRHVITLGVF